jgi:hypothetical protein
MNYETKNEDMLNLPDDLKDHSKDHTKKTISDDDFFNLANTEKEIKEDLY